VKKDYREALYRNELAMARLKGRLVTVCGAGALGANLAESLVRAGVDRLRVIDQDRVEEHNLSTQPFQLDDVGAGKAEILALNLYRAVGV
jgi:tRNA A37 threonylcarbamoyladenosine dehydratase